MSTNEGYLHCSARAGIPAVVVSNNSWQVQCPEKGERISFVDTGVRTHMLQHAPLHFRIPEVGNERLQHPQGVEHVPLLQFRLQLALLGRGLLLEGEAGALGERLLRAVGLQGNELGGGRGVRLLATAIGGLFGGGIGMAPGASDGWQRRALLPFVTLRKYRT